MPFAAHFPITAWENAPNGDDKNLHHDKYFADLMQWLFQSRAGYFANYKPEKLQSIDRISFNYPPPPLNINAISLIRLETKSCCIFTVIYFVYLIPFPENFCPVGSKKTGEGSFWCPSRIGNFHLVNIDLRIKKGDNPMEQDLRNMADVVKFPSQLSQFFVGSSKMAEYDTLLPPSPPSCWSILGVFFFRFPSSICLVVDSRHPNWYFNWVEGVQSREFPSNPTRSKAIEIENIN